MRGLGVSRKLMENVMLWKKTVVLGVGMFVLAGAAPLWAGENPCPKDSVIQQKLEPILIGAKVSVKKVTPSSVTNLCQVHVLVNDRNEILYTDSGGRYVFFGQIHDSQEKRNLTQEVLDNLNRFSPKDLDTLKELTAFTVGSDKASKTIYFITDPHCPYCKQAESDLEVLANEGVVNVRYVLFPLNIHPGARESCIALLCDKKGHEEYKNNYKSDNQCAEGAEKIDAVMALMFGHSVGGTPTYIFPDGTFRSGVMDRGELEEALKK